MNKITYFLIIFLLFNACQTTTTTEKVVDDAKPATSVALAQSAAIKAIKEVGNLSGDTAVFDRPAKGYIVVYAPVLNDDYIFDHNLHIAGMYTYFEQEKGEKVETILIGKDDEGVFNDFLKNAQSTHKDAFSELTFIHDKDSILIQSLKLDTTHLDHGGVAVAYDKTGKELFQETEYKCQGEKLQRMYQHFYPRNLSLPKTAYEIKVGQKIPPELTKYFADYMGKQNVLMTFYPAPLSHSCSIQMRTLGQFALENMETKDLKVIAVSIGSLQQVEAWQLHQPIKGLEMRADSTGAVSNAFNSLLKDEYGVIYSDRTVFLIDKQGVVQYINQDYDVRADLDVLENEIQKL